MGKMANHPIDTQQYVWDPVKMFKTFGPSGVDVLLSKLHLDNGKTIYRLELPDGKTYLVTHDKQVIHELANMLNEGLLGVEHGS